MAVARLSPGPGPASRCQQRTWRSGPPRAPAGLQRVTLRAAGRGGLRWGGAGWGGAARRSLRPIGCRAASVPPPALTPVSLSRCQSGARCACAAGAALAGGVGASAGAAAGGERDRERGERERGEPRARAGNSRRSRPEQQNRGCLPPARRFSARPPSPPRPHELGLRGGGGGRQRAPRRYRRPRHGRLGE